MIRFRSLPAALVLLLAPLTAAEGAPLAIVKAVTVVSDGVNTVNPKLLPGAIADITLTATNPLLNGVLPVTIIKDVSIVDLIPANMKLRVADLNAAGSGPVEFQDGSVLVPGVLASNMTYKYTALQSTTDNLSFSTDGVDFTYQPVADANGYDTKVRAIKVKATGTQAAGSNYRLRYRIAVQ